MMEDNEMPKALFKSLIAEVNCQSMLLWNHRGIRCLPAELLSRARHISKLYLKNNYITYLPRNIGYLSNLKTLHLCGNAIEELNDCIGDLVSLVVLDVSKNRLKTLPAAIGRLSKLKSLSLCHNQIVRLPEEICSLSALNILMVRSNELQTLPKDVHKMVALQGLFLDHNYLQYLPSAIAHLPILTHLSCCHNDLRYLPCQPFRTSLLGIYFDFNSALNFLPYCILDQVKTRDTFDPFVIPAYGCFERNLISENRVMVSLSPCVSPLSICLPPRLKSISCYDQETSLSSPPLLEICLRRVWKMLADNIPVGTHFLPRNLNSMLSKGPIFFCERCQLTNIFIYASVVIIAIYVTSEDVTPGRKVPSVLFFCGDLCAKLFIESCPSKHSMEYKKWLKCSLHKPFSISVL